MIDRQKQFLQAANVSRETLERLEVYERLLKKWNPAINLVSKATLADIWGRHFLDSAQLFPLFPTQSAHWVDIGSGGGFPGIVLAIQAEELESNPKMTLIESDQRKAAFLLTVIRELSLSSKVIVERVEKAEAQTADVLSARALAPLDKLLAFAKRHLLPTGTAIFPKGETYKQEIKHAREHWRFDVKEHKSATSANSVILEIGAIERV